MFSLICAWIKGWVNNREAGDLRRHRAHYDVIVYDEIKANCSTYLIYNGKIVSKTGSIFLHYMPVLCKLRPAKGKHTWTSSYE